MKGNFNKLINSDTPVLIDFWAPWCGPCHQLSPIIEQVASELDDKLKVIKINVDNNQPLAGQFQIKGIPTMILFKNGQPVWRQSGVIGKEQIQSAITPHL